MSGQRFIVRPLDTLFFRDGRPFNQDDEGMADVRSLFPPRPTVMAGAFRAALARAQGWDGSRSWAKDDALGEALGDGPHETGRLGFGPPVVLRRTEDDGWQRLYAPPLHLLLGKTPDKKPALTFLRPDEKREFASDQGQIKLPALTVAAEETKPLADGWLTPAGLAAVLAGNLPADEDIVPEAELWALEFRVGLQRDGKTRTAVPGMLYAASHVRLAKGVALGVEVEGLDGWGPQSPAPLGGFQRVAEIEPGDWEDAAIPAPSQDGRHLVVLTSPLLVENLPGWDRPGTGFPEAVGLPGELVAACLERPVMIGGWDGRRKNGGFAGPIPSKPHLPAGSVFFLRGGTEEMAKLLEGERRRLGASEKLGFGEYLVGCWPEERNS